MRAQDTSLFQPFCLFSFAPMSARKPIACSPLPERSTPTTPVPPMHLDSPFGELGSHHVRCAVLFQAQLRIGVQIAADLGKLVLIAGDGVMGRVGHGTLLSGGKAKYARGFPA